jgi:arylsulfatase A-like enzyme
VKVPARGHMSKPPHLLIFNPDSWRGDVLGHLGHPAAQTPVLDRMVREDSVSFRNAFVQNPVCTPSRCSFMTGWYPHTAGHRTMRHMLRPHEPMLLRTLKQNGYHVFWGGKNDVVPRQLGFDDYCSVKYEPPGPFERGTHSWNEWRGDPKGDSYFSFYFGKLEPEVRNDVYYDWDQAHVLGAIEQIKHAPKDKPLCLFMPLGLPHPPYAVPDPWYSAIDRAKVPPRVKPPRGWTGKPGMARATAENNRLKDWDEDRWAELRATYYATCMRADYFLGQLLEALKGAGLYDDTAIFVFSDHGDFTGDYSLVEKTQNTFEDCLTRSPFIIKPPKGVPVKPGVRNALVELIDFPATVEALTGMPAKHTHFGRSLLPILAGESDQHRDAVFCEGGRNQGEKHAMEFQGDWEYLYAARVSVQARETGEHGRATMVRTHRHKYVRRLYEQDELYDLERDPGEVENRIDDPDYRAVLGELKERLLTFFQETADVVPWDLDTR